MERNMECPICVEKTPPSRVATCPYCDFSSCRSCLRTFVCGASDDPSCMSCKRALGRSTLITMLGKNCVNGDLKRHREEVLFEREKAMMPSTQAYVDQELQRRRNDQLLSDMKKEKKRLRQRLLELERSMHHVERNLTPDLGSERRSFMMKCGKEGCRGFLSTAYKCTICSLFTCPDCLCIKAGREDENHVCDPDAVENVKAIKRDARPCPGCGEFISKASGCDQMWCVTCHTAFSWRTGQKVNGLIHNPHFYEFARNNLSAARNPADIPCGGAPTSGELITFLNSTPNTGDDRRVLLSLHRLRGHVEEDELRRYAVVGERETRDQRVKYMLGEMEEKEMRRNLQKIEKAGAKRGEILQILQMFVNVIGDLFRQMIVEKRTRPFTGEMLRLCKYANESCLSVAKEYDCVAPIITTDLRVFPSSSLREDTPISIDFEEKIEAHT